MFQKYIYLFTRTGYCILIYYIQHSLRTTKIIETQFIYPIFFSKTKLKSRVGIENF